MTADPTWTILIPTIGQRDKLFRRLLDRLLPQLDAASGRVRILACFNEGRPALGEIRDALVSAAAPAEYVSFIDDDDMVPEDFVATCLAAMATRPDKLGFKVGYHVDGVLKEVADQQLSHGRWYRDASTGELRRDITHVCPIRWEIAERAYFARARRGLAEDRVWVKQVRQYVSTEIYIDRVLYDYLYSTAVSAWQDPDKIEQGARRPEIDHPYFAWLDVPESHDPPASAEGSHRAGIYRPTPRSGDWHNLLPFVIDVEASYGTFATEAGFKQDHAGLGVWKSVDDMQRYACAIARTEPDVVVETGTRWGGFAAWLVDTFGVEVITVDVDEDTRPAALPGVTFVTGDSKDPDVVAEVVKLVDGRRVMVSLDADHHAPHVLGEIRAYAPLVSPGCHIVVEDGLADIVSPRRARRLGARIPQEGGPLVAISNTLATDPRWMRDRDVEQLSPISHSPAGWWLRR